MAVITSKFIESFVYQQKAKFVSITKNKNLFFIYNLVKLLNFRFIINNYNFLTNIPQSMQ